MDISAVNDSLQSIELPEETKKAILQLIDLKIDNDMKEVIAELKHLDVKIQSVSSEIKVVYWVVGIAMAIIVFIVAKK